LQDGYSVAHPSEKRNPKVADHRAGRLRYLIGQQAKSVARLRRFLPARLYEQGVRSTFSLDRN